MSLLYICFAVLLLASLAFVLRPVYKRRVFCAGAALIAIIVSFALYSLVGSPKLIPLMAERDQEIGRLKTVITARSQDVRAHPDDLAAWVELGTSFMQTGQYDASANAFKRAVLVSRGNPTLIMAYAKALIAAAGGNVTDEAEKSLKAVLLQEPQNEQARYYLAVRLLQIGHPEEAMKAMKKLYGSLKPDSPVKDMIDRQIGRQ